MINIIKMMRKSFSFNISVLLIISILILTTMSSIALASSHEEGGAPMTPSDQMFKEEAAADGQPTEIQLNDGQQNTMLATVAGVFIIIPVGVWIFSHQKKRNKKKA